jgi:thiol:disulfide interchange protein DsbC
MNRTQIIPKIAAAAAAAALSLSLLASGGCASIAKSSSATDTNRASDARTMQVVRDTIHERFPDLKIEDVQPSPVPGFYEVFTGVQLLYSNSTADYIFVGKLVDSRTKQDLADAKLAKRLTIDFKTLPFDQAITIVKGNGSRKMALFEDPDCPFCQRLEKELVKVHDVTLYIFLLPFTDLHPGARERAHAIWCTPDRAAAWSHWMLERKKPEPSPDCKTDPLDALQSVGSNINVSATPTFFLESGRRLQGAASAEELEQLLGSDASDGKAPVADVPQAPAPGAVSSQPQPPQS